MTFRKGSNHKEMTVLYYPDGRGDLPGMFQDESTLLEEHLTLYSDAEVSQKRSKGTWEIK